MSREDDARALAVDKLDAMWSSSDVPCNIQVADHGTVLFSADGKQAFVEVFMTVDMEA